MMKSDEMNKGDRVQVTGWEEAKGRYGTVDAVTAGFVDVTLDGGEQLCFHRPQLTKVADTAADPLTPHMARIRELHDFADWLAAYPSISQFVTHTHFYRWLDADMGAAGSTIREDVDGYAEALGGKWRPYGSDGEHVQMTRAFGGFVLQVIVPRVLTVEELRVDEPPMPFSDDEKIGMTMNELTARRDEIVAEVTAADRFYDQPGVRKAMGGDVVMGGGLVVPGNHPLMSMLTAAVEADKADKAVTASAEMNAVVDALNKPREHRCAAEERLLNEVFE
jgi:hypothetical protein